MATEVRIPTTGNAGEDAVLVEWLVEVGQQVEAGATLLTIETAKSTVDVEAPTGGTLLAQRAGAGDEVPEFSVVGVIGAEGEAVVEAQTMGGEQPAEPAPETPEPDDAVAPVLTDGAGPGPAPTRRRVSASPRARRIADERSVDVAQVAGSGPLGRVLAADVERAASTQAPPTAAQPAPTVAPATSRTGLESVRVVPVRGARKVTAQRMHASLAGTAQVTLTRYAEADRMLEWVGRLRAAAEGDGDKPRVGVNDALLYVAARVVGEHPAANSWFSWDGIQQFDRVDLGFAVDTDHGLLVPVIRDAHLLSIGRLAAQARDAIGRARSGGLQPDEMDGGTFTVSNLGGLGVHWFTPVLNSPQSCILGVGAAHCAGDGPTLLPLSLTFDHRALDGGAAASLLADLAAAIAHVDVLDAF
ncbi:dihydrolipoamide acetyltransferase family protein [Agrococcus sp. ARC_14]|uniref:dihydrolipoamide acetyltransferase family protein n=1 Tax=Agrococcus sp. ARC_14 TaxID=2919927 RepID=UPI001F06A688|nr:dihydrolipoamide acetyltransferase family protein [Agrococcus sp. ARC_14]MCH1883926.1 2-oxo acid dehydrogenase subunit E2 [Agrococcus sp. ARC_14]